MFTTYDRHLLGRLLHTFGVFFVAAYGLYIVIDLFTNVDDFQEGASTTGGLALLIAEYYLYRASEFFEMAGPILIVLAVITVLALLQKNSEAYPILAAGIPARRLLRPLLVATVILNGILVVNQEFVIPSIAVALQTPRGSATARVQKVEPVYDYSNQLMHIDGEQVLVQTQEIVNASFTLPRCDLSTQTYALTAENAVFVSATPTTPSGWLLRNLKSPLDPTILTEEGRKRVIPRDNGKDVFIVSAVSFDQLYNGGRNLKLLSSAQLVERIRNPSTGMVPVRSQTLALHSRVTRPLLCVLNIVIALPLVMRRETRSLITNMAVCALVLGVFYGVAQACAALGTLGMLRPDLAAWLPVILTGFTCTLTSGFVQT
ncbi:MAG: LptF/LptG family permease [Planctomycetaceae bacterium]|nr:LptF/LptG family permease [Planctomycetaceae bacterium]